MKKVSSIPSSFRNKGKFLFPLAAALLFFGAAISSRATEVFSTDFSKGAPDSQGWAVTGTWTMVDYGSGKPDLAKNPGLVVRYPANSSTFATLTRKFTPINNPSSLTLTFDAGYGWGDPAHSTGIDFMLLDDNNNGYIFDVARAKGPWGVKWGKVVKGVPDSPLNNAPSEIDTTQTSIVNGGGVRSFTLTRDAGGNLSFNADGWTGGPLTFNDTTTTSFSQVVIRGTPNYDDEVWSKVRLAVGEGAPAPAAAATEGGSPTPAADAGGTTAISANTFLNSMGINTHIQHGQPAQQLVGPLKYLGIRSIRDEGDGNYDMTGLLLLHKEAGVHVVFGPGSGATDERFAPTIKALEELAAAGALKAIEGPNEPNNFGGVTYHGKNSNTIKSWVPVAEFQRDYYQAAKSDPILKNYPVYGISEVGAEVDNVGLQFLTIPKDAGTLMPDGTQYADYLTCHNYACGKIAPKMIDNQVTLAAKTNPNTPSAGFDHFYGNNGHTWAKGFTGYTESELDTIPKVTTETGIWADEPGGDGEDRQGKALLNLYLAQYKAGWSYTAIYEYADSGEGNCGFYHSDLTTPRKAVGYLHNFTTILADTGTRAMPGKVNYSIPNQPATVHDLLMQKDNGTFELAVWGEQVTGSNDIKVDLGAPYKSVKVYDPTVGTKPIQTLADADSVPLTMSDHVMILEFK